MFPHLYVVPNLFYVLIAQKYSLYTIMTVGTLSHVVNREGFMPVCICT